MPNQPNFLVIMTDQHCYQQLACHGNSVLKTPNLDRLFARGTSINGMHTATPICMPNRQAFLTMRMNSVNGGHSNGVGLDLDSNTFPELLRASGYKTALIGKSHLQNITEFEPFLQAEPLPDPANPNQVAPPADLANAAIHLKRDKPDNLLKSPRGSSRCLRQRMMRLGPYLRGTLEALLADTDTLTKILTYHVIPGKVMAADVVGLNGQEAGTVQGENVMVKVDGGNVMINDANVIITDIEASNGVIHVIDQVILPPTVAAAMASSSSTESAPATMPKTGADNSLPVLPMLMLMLAGGFLLLGGAYTLRQRTSLS